MEILTTFANHAAIAIENARLYAAVTRERDRARWLYKQTDAELARRVQELTTIEEISRQLTGMLDAQRVMDLVLERAMQVTKADRGVIALYESEQRMMRLMTLQNFPRDLERYRSEPWPVSRGIIGRVARTGEVALVLDVTQDPDYVEVVTTTRSQLGVPIMHDRHVLGVLSLECDQRTAFVEEHVRFIQLLAEHAAIGINNAQLFQRVVEGRDQLQAILNSTQDIVIMFDTDTNVILINPRVRELFGIQVERWLRSVDLLNKVDVSDSPFFKATDIDPARLAQIAKQVQQAPRQSVIVAFSYQKDSRQYYLEGAISPVLGAKGEILGRVIVLRDVTRQRELEEFRTELTSMIVHNLQGPLAALISSLDTLLENGQADPDIAAELLRIATSSGRILHSLIESVLWIRCLEDRQMPLNLHAQPLSGVVQSVMREYKPMAASTGVRLEAMLDTDLPPVFVDEEIVGRVFSNLLDNAFKHTPRGGRIQVRATLEGDADDPAILCAVSDTGSGIAASMQDVLFDKFRRAGQPLHGRRKGMGIGLHYCKLAVETHGGRIWVESQPGQGCVFYFTLPVAAHEPA
jgi:NtrC-family two-component system sensor histidine kinase KinB